MTRQFALLTVLAVLGLPGVYAQGPSAFYYDYAEVNLVDYDAGGTGIQLGGSFDIDPHVNLLGKVSVVEDYTQIDFGGGYHMRLKEFNEADFYGFAGFQHGEFDLPDPFGNYDDSGLFVGAGIRVSPVPKLELDGSLSYQSIFDGDFLLSFDGLYAIAPNMQIRAGIDLSDNDAIVVGLRYYF